MSDYKELLSTILSEESFDKNQEELLKGIKNNFKNISKDLEKGDDAKLRSLLKPKSKLSSLTSTTPTKSDNKSGISKTGSTEKPTKPVADTPQNDKDQSKDKKSVLDKLSDKWNDGKRLSDKIDSSLNSLATSLVGKF
jgi:hypothetical protein